MKTFIIILIVLALILGGFYLFNRNSEVEVVIPDESESVENTTPEEEDLTEEEEVKDDTKTVIGSSVEGNDIVAYHYGEGDNELLFAAGIHGGYEWNTTLVAYELMDYFESDPSVIPDGYRVTVIPVVNPDGLEEIVGTTGRFDADSVTATLEETVPGRFNSNDVDLNRNFDCDWQETGTWQNKEVSGGSKVFSEPESQAVRDYVLSNNISGALVWYSAAGGVYASNCRNGVSDKTKELTTVYANASGYPAHQEFDYYEITGDMVNWMAKEEIPAISVLLTNHTDLEWSKNKNGVDAFLATYSQ